MERSVKDLFGGSLKPNDPRRFLIEAMVGAMSSDGHVDRREARVMEEQIAEHALFQGLGPTAARTLIELSTDAIKFAGGSIGRGAAIAPGELDFLEALRIALRISPLEADKIVRAAKSGALSEYLDDRYLRIRSMISVAAEVFALRALARAIASDEHRFKVRDFFAAIPDLALSTDELDAELYRAFRRPREPGAQVFSELSRVAATLPDPVDRYWIVVYTLVAEAPATVPSWRVIPFMGVMQAAFQIVDTDMKLAVIDALTFPQTMARPT